MTKQAEQVLDGRFKLLDVIGRGGMSTVYRAQDLADRNRPVAVKVPLPMFSSGLGSWSMFQREAEIGALLDHPAILRFVDQTDGRQRPAYVVTELVEGETLADVLRRRAPLPEREALDLARRLCGAVEHMHARGIVHYDIKPANLMMCGDRTIRLIDFGLAHAAAVSRLALAGPPPAIGSSDYVAPEQIRRRRGRKSVDIYSMGAVLYEMLTGRPPFPGDEPFVVASARTFADPPAPRAINPALSPAAEEIVLRALRRDAAQRYASAADMRRDLERPHAVVVSGLAERLQPVTRFRRLIRMLRYGLLVTVVPVAIQVLLFLLLWSRHARRG